MQETDSSWIVNRVKLYGVLAALGCLNLFDEVLVLSLFLLGIPALAGWLAWNALIYLPLVDWPSLAWRRTHKRSAFVFWLFLALIVPVGVPLSVGIWKAAIATSAFQEMGLEREDVSVPPFVPRDLLIIGDNDNRKVSLCEDVCQSLLWSGAVRRVFVGLEFPEGRQAKKATLFTVLHQKSCGHLKSYDGGLTRNGFCISGREMENPPFDAIVRLSRRYYDPNLLVFDRSVSTFEQQVRIYDCREACKLLRAQPTATGERLVFPLMVALETNIDSGHRPIGPYLLTREFVLYSPLDTIRTTLSLPDSSDVTE
jgi:hypothetical protein